MTDERASSIRKPTPTMVGDGSSDVIQSIAIPSVSADAATSTPADAYDLSNDRDAAGMGFLNLIRAHRALGQRNLEKLTVSMQALAAAKTPKEFTALQHKLLTESLAAAISDSAAIGHLTTIAFTAAFDSTRKKIGDLRAGTKRQE